MQGFFNIDKPAGLTSFDVVRRLKKTLPRGIKLGHLGTLDPMAEGVLPVAVGQATRLIPYLGEEHKTYRAKVSFGAVSDTQDAQGQIEYRMRSAFSREELIKVMTSFTGVIPQVPPMFSAVHHQGKRLYELARDGIEVPREARTITIYRLEMEELVWAGDYLQADLLVECSRGTYIRTLAHDIGQVMGTGAFLSALVRVASGVFQLEQAVSLSRLCEGSPSDFLLPLDYPLGHLAAVCLQDESQVLSVMNGQSLFWPNRLPEGDLRIYSMEGRLIALGRSQGEEGTTLKPMRVLKTA